MEQEQTPLPPLVSDEPYTKWQTEGNSGQTYWSVKRGSNAFSIQSIKSRPDESAADFLVNELNSAHNAAYEQARKSDREVIQALCDAAHHYMKTCPADSDLTSAFYSAGLVLHTSLALAKSQCGIEPKTEQR